MNIRGQLVCTWCGLGFAVVGLLGMLIAGFVPPMSPDLSPEAIAAIYQEKTLPIRFGVLLILVSSGFMSAFVAAIAMQMKRIEGGIGPYTATQLAAGAITALIIVAGCVFWTAAAFRPEP